MTLKILDYEVYITAKRDGEKTKDATKGLLNLMVVQSQAAADCYENWGFDALERESLRIAFDIHDALDNTGYYDSVRKDGDHDAAD